MAAPGEEGAGTPGRRFKSKEEMEQYFESGEVFKELARS